MSHLAPREISGTSYSKLYVVPCCAYGDRPTGHALSYCSPSWCVSAVPLLACWNLSDKCPPVSRPLPQQIYSQFSIALAAPTKAYVGGKTNVWRCTVCVTKSGFYRASAYWRAYARYWYSKSGRLPVCPSVRNVPISDENGLTFRHSFLPYGSAIILVLPASNTFMKFRQGSLPAGALNTGGV